ncbi:SusC/RagA family TonB-linked outer membrane protein [Botryobacter ruber]|uniref:SusC/RagA family TonB-linked outer membrane protein n=1 Tax=Botryobacter ruber TaxID=2171629 RepID=UPI000E0C0C52|nr:TonB-dependent receptor [Botryobacter ruber]
MRLKLRRIKLPVSALCASLCLAQAGWPGTAQAESSWLNFQNGKTEQVEAPVVSLSEVIKSSSQQNQVTVRGRVTAQADGTGLPGVTIMLKGNSSVGTTTDIDGNFSLNVPDGSGTLVVSYVGYVSQEVPINSRNQISVRLASDTKALDEVVVVGYGTQRKATATGAISTVDAKVFEDRGPIANPVAALQGQVPGVAVTRNSAQPGRESWDFMIRGASSVNGTEPLIVVDGVPLPNTAALNSFNPADIENISFLKDAAASIYGARAAGGVVLITTKRAKTDKPTISYNGSVSLKKIGLMPDLVDITGWGPMILEARTNDGFGANDVWVNLAKAAIYANQNNIDIMTREQYLAAGFTGFTDVRDFGFFPGTMQDRLWGDATSTEHQLSISGRTDNSGYRVSLGYLGDGSLLQVGNNSNKRYNLRLTHDYQFSPRVKLESNVSLEKNNITQPANIGAVLNNGNQPGAPAATADGRAYLWGSGIGNASVVSIAELGGDSREANTRINANFNLTVDILKNLKAVGAAGYYFHDADYRTRENVIQFYDYSGGFIAGLAPSGGNRSFYQRGNRREHYYNLNGYLEYANKFGEDHEVRVMAGGQYERNEFNRYLARTLDIIPDVPSSLSLSTGDPSSKSVAEAQNHYALAGSFGRINYTFRDKYLFETNARYDGSSRFRPEDRWKFFYGFLAGWRLSEESYLRDVDFLSELKLRASWGSVGNQSGIGMYDYIQFMNLNFSPGPTSNSFPIIGGSPVVRVSPAGLVAFDRTWETVNTSNLGLDFSFLNNRLSGSAEYFIKRNENMLIARTLPSVLGANAPEGNNGELKTWGWEFALNWRDQLGDVSYHIGGNVSDFKNELVDFGGQTLIQSSNRGLNGAVEGYPINSYFGLEYAGRIQDQEHLDAYKQLIANNNVGIPSGTTPNTSLQLGDNMFRDVNGDGRITFPEDAKFLGTDDPRWIYGFNGGLQWKGFDFNFIFQGVGKRTLIRDGNWRIPAAVVYQAQNAAFENQWWTPERTDARLPRISTTGTINNYNYYPSDWVAENGAYLRLKNLVVGYTLPNALTQKVNIQTLRFYFSGNDLWEVSHINDGWDPEAPRRVANTGDSDNNNVSTFSQRFPFYRFLTFGVNVTL